MGIHRCLPLLAALLGLALAACSGGASGVREQEARDVPSFEGGALSQHDALEYMRFVEERPLAPEANERRRLAFEWVVTAEALEHVTIDASYVEPLDASRYPFGGELMMQYVFGAATWALGGDRVRAGSAGLAEAGLRSMIAAYRNIVQLDPKLRQPWLERLEEIRRRGALGHYVDSVEASRR